MNVFDGLVMVVVYELGIFLVIIYFVVKELIDEFEEGDICGEDVVLIWF